MDIKARHMADSDINDIDGSFRNAADMQNPIRVEHRETAALMESSSLNRISIGTATVQCSCLASSDITK